MQSYHQTLQIPVHHQGFKIFVCNSTTFNQSVIDIWNTAVPNNTINSFVVEMYVKYPRIYEHLEGDIIHQPGENEYLYGYHCHTRLAPYGGENKFMISDILPQCLWNELMDTWWRWKRKRKNLWYDAWKDTKLQIFYLRAHYEPGFPIAPHPITDRHRAIRPRVQEVQGGNDGVPPVPEQRASISPVPGLAPAHWIRRLICIICYSPTLGTAFSMDLSFFFSSL